MVDGTNIDRSFMSGWLGDKGPSSRHQRERGETHEAETKRTEAGLKTHVANALICFWVYDLR